MTTEQAKRNVEEAEQALRQAETVCRVFRSPNWEYATFGGGDDSFHAAHSAARLAYDLAAATLDANMPADWHERASGCEVAAQELAYQLAGEYAKAHGCELGQRCHIEDIRPLAGAPPSEGSGQ